MSMGPAGTRLVSTFLIASLHFISAGAQVAFSFFSSSPLLSSTVPTVASSWSRLPTPRSFAPFCFKDVSARTQLPPLPLRLLLAYLRLLLCTPHSLLPYIDCIPQARDPVNTPRDRYADPEDRDVRPLSISPCMRRLPRLLRLTLAALGRSFKHVRLLSPRLL